MEGKIYDPESIAKTIVFEGHSVKKHLNKFADLNIKDKSAFEKHIISTLRDKSTCVFKTIDKKDYYYNAKTNTFIAIDPLNKHGGTCLRPKNKKLYFLDQKKNDKTKRSALIKDKGLVKAQGKSPRIKMGGYEALYKGKKLDHGLKNIYQNKAELKGVIKDRKAGKIVQRKIQNNLEKLAKKEKEIKKQNEEKIKAENKKSKDLIAKLRENKKMLEKEQAAKKPDKLKKDKLDRDKQLEIEREERRKAIEEAQKQREKEREK